MKKWFSFLLILAMVSGYATSLAETSSDLVAQYQEELNYGRYINGRATAYEYDSFYQYCVFWRIAAYRDIETKGLDITEVERGQEIVDKLKQLRSQLVQVVDDPEDVCWYIWGDNMAQAPDAASYDYTHMFDGEGFQPFLLPYLLEDQTQVKGNVIIIAGGGFTQRCNDIEGYPVAEIFNDMGYNAYVLNRRVAPSPSIDSSLDLQRSIRYIRYHAEEYGIAQTDKIVTVGFSGGGLTIMNQLNTCYGDILPTAVYPDYVADEIDLVNSDYPVAMPIYGVVAGFTTENQNMPAFFLHAGTKDDFGRDGALAMVTTCVENDWPVQLYLACDAPHGESLTGFTPATGSGTESVKVVVPIIESFLDVQLGYVPAHFTITNAYEEFYNR